MFKARSLVLLLTLACSAAYAQKKYGPGVSDTEIRIGQTMPYSGPVSAASTGGKAAVAYFTAVNKAGGINGRKVNLISLDDGYSPPRTVEVTRKLVEDEKVLLLYGSVGTPTNIVVQKYLNAKKVPQLFLLTGSPKFKEPGKFPWTMGFLPSYELEGRALAKYVQQNVEQPKIAIISQNDDLGKDFVRGFKAGLGDAAKTLIVSESTFEITDPTLNSQTIAAKSSGANVLFYAGTQKHAILQLRAKQAAAWHPVHVTGSLSSGIESVLRPAGLDISQGLVTASYLKDLNDPAWGNDADVKTYLEWCASNLPGTDCRDGGVVAGYMVSALLETVLKKAGDNLTPENIRDISANLKNVPVPLLLPGIAVNTSPTDYGMVKQVQIQRFEKEGWKRLGSLLGAD